MSKYKFTKDHRDSDIQRIQREIEDNLVSFDKNGNIVIDKDIYCKSLHVEGASLYIGGVRVKGPKEADADGFWKFDKNKKEMIISKGVVEGSAPKVDDVTGTLADLAQQFNELKSRLEDLGILEK